MRPPRRRGLALGFAALLACGASFWSAEEYVASLNAPEARQALGLARAVMPERTANRLDVTFVPDQPPEARDRALRQIAGELLDVVWRRQGLPTVTVVERAPDGTEVNRVTTRLLGTAPPPLMGGTAD